MSRFKQILDYAADLVERKNSDYGNSYSTIRKKWGPVAFHVRIADKLARIEQLSRYEAKVDESILDTLRDIIGYCILEIAHQSNVLGTTKDITFQDIAAWCMPLEETWEEYQKLRAEGPEQYHEFIAQYWWMYEQYGLTGDLEWMIEYTVMEIAYREEAA